MLARDQREFLQYNAHLKHFEGLMVKALTKASKVSKQKGAGFFKIGSSSAQQPTIELDGRPTASSDMFSVLSVSYGYSDDQLMNIQTFCAMRKWLKEIYIKPSLGPQEELLSRKLDSQVCDCFVEYCLRVINQSRLNIVDDPNFSRAATKNNSKTLVTICVNEAIKVLDVLCAIDSSLVPNIFPIVRSTNLSVEALEFLLHHGPVVSFADFNPLLKTLFAANTLEDCVFARNFVSFCRRNMAVLESKTSLFVTMFPFLLKCAVWYPLSLMDGIRELIRKMVSKDSFLELLHTVLDLPLVAGALDMFILSHQEQQDEFGEDEKEDALFFKKDDANDPMRVLQGLLLRNERIGMQANYWSNESSVMVVQAFCNSCLSLKSVRIEEVTRLCPSLLNELCDALLERGNEDELKELLCVLFDRADRMYPSSSYQSNVRKVLQNKVLAVFHRCPVFVVELRELILNTITSSSPDGELVLNLCWIIGEHTNPTTLKNYDAGDVLRSYHEALELFTYERLSFVKLGINQISESLNEVRVMGPNKHDVYASRLMLVLIAALSKIASRQQPLVSRVVLCLSKVLHHKDYMYPAVARKARESIRLLNNGAYASILFGESKNAFRKEEQRYDDFTSYGIFKRPMSTNANVYSY